MAKPPLVELTDAVVDNTIPGGYVLVEGNSLRKILWKANERDHFHRMLREIQNQNADRLRVFFEDYPE